MKRLFVSLFLIGTVAACTSRQSSDATTTADSSRIDSAATETSATVDLTPTLSSLGLTSDHDWRNVNLGDDFTAAKATEKAEAFEQDASHIGYTQEFDNLESIDYQYFQAGNKVSSIQVDFYLNSASAVKTYQQELATYLTARYGPSTTSAGTLAWKRGNVTLKDVSKGKDFGLKLTIQ
ncbi:hypothetical protein [Fibrella forsythiae]|uniref:Lipoprotein n=1 Tax=Fibrella forsythiae TaxID=2817061 RepID=A0ABS3JQ13_9BACT|nr:hypothetical protein [Fibrella forsythiae]MBO0952086.1 hypothetical protein [Fibrella forsythiae]